MKRDVRRFASEAFDLIIVGGGVYGVMLSLESGFRGKRVLLLEQNDFGYATTYNHLRTLHGGLRYLQTLDLPRFFESVRERQWFFIHFPQMVSVLPCLMPLYDRGIRRRSIFKLALRINDQLSARRNRHVISKKHIPNGRIVNPEKVKELFPMVDTEGMTGGAIWYDGMIMEPERLLMELLSWSRTMETCFLNYVKAETLLKENNRTIGLKATDSISGSTLEFRAPVVVNAAGPWCREVAQQFDRDFKPLFPAFLLLWNVLFKREALSDFSVSPQKDKGHTYFIHNWKGRMLVGTGEALVKNPKQNSTPDETQIASFINDLNSAVPSLSLDKADIDHIYHGLLPADVKGNLTKREVILSHERIGGPKGLFSVSGIKFTTSRLVAQKMLDLIFPETRKMRLHGNFIPPEPNSHQKTFAFDWVPDKSDARWKETLRRIIKEESVIHIDDLLFRRTSLGENKRRLQAIVPELRDLFPWDDFQWKEELKRLTLFM